MTEVMTPVVMAIDTNVLVYAEGEGDAARCASAQKLLARVQPTAVVLPVQVLGELHRVMTGRFRRDGRAVRDDILECIRRERGPGKYVQIVEPCAELPGVFSDELRRKCFLEAFFVFERIVDLPVRHRAGVEPRVEHIGDALHYASAITPERDFVHDMLVQIGDC